MRKLIVLVVISAMLYGGYWFVGRNQIEDRLTEGLAAVDAGRYELSYTDLSIRGFPSRFDSTLTDLDFFDPVTGVRWQSPFFQLFALAYRPNEVIAVFSPEQTIELGGTSYLVETDDMRASGKVSANAMLAVQSATVTMELPKITSQAGFDLSMSSVLAAMRLKPETEQTYNTYAQARNIALPMDVRRRLDPTNLQPEFVQSVQLEVDLDLSHPIALNDPADAAPTIEALGLKRLTVTWGDISLEAIGDATPDAAGAMNGSVTLTARNWQQILDMGVANGMVEADRRLLVTEILNSFDETPDFPDTLTLTVTLSDGQMRVNGFDLGPAPRLR